MPDCPLSPPDATFDKTYTETTLYFITGNNLGNFYGYNWSGSQWTTNAAMQSIAKMPTYSSPAIMFNNADTYLISGRGGGSFSGYNWTGTGWSSYNAITNGLPNLGGNSKPSIFYKDGEWNIISGKSDGTFSAFTYDGASWVSNATLENGLGDIGTGGIASVGSGCAYWYNYFGVCSSVTCSKPNPAALTI